MDLNDTNISNTSLSDDQPGEELSHSDKMIGIFTEPNATFEKTSLFPPKVIDWFLPVFLLLIVVALANIIMMSNPEIKLSVQEKQMEQFEKNFDDMVSKGQMTREQADQQLNAIQDNMEKFSGGIGMVISTISILIMGFIFFFFLTTIYFLFARFVFKDNASFSSTLVANGLPSYIVIIQVIIATIIAMVANRLVNDTSAAALMDSDRSTYTGWLLAKIDPFTIWAYIVVAIGMIKMFKSNSSMKYYLLVFGIWIIGGLILFLIAQAVPMLGGFIMR